MTPSHVFAAAAALAGASVMLGAQTPATGEDVHVAYTRWETGPR